jgi:hypothetical protein
MFGIMFAMLIVCWCWLVFVVVLHFVSREPQAASASKLEGGHEALAQQQQQQSVSSSSGGGGGLVAPSQGGVMPAEGDDDDAELVAAMARVRRSRYKLC